MERRKGTAGLQTHRFGEVQWLCSKASLLDICHIFYCHLHMLQPHQTSAAMTTAGNKFSFLSSCPSATFSFFRSLQLARWWTFPLQGHLSQPTVIAHECLCQLRGQRILGEHPGVSVLKTCAQLCHIYGLEWEWPKYRIWENISEIDIHDCLQSKIRTLIPTCNGDVIVANFSWEC